ncbi:MAG: DNA mismatch repair endonuclease MutL [Bdellovibrionota bacterium]
MEISRILALDEQLANQIAAGEVVERPGSALKELVENSLDAGATSITVKIAEGGVKLLEVADNGSGIHADDFHLALGRHATSKIRSTEDLFSIRSWGFRGEALASIGAVSRLTLSSRASGAARGRELVCEGGAPRGDKEIARPVGTTVRVEDLFFNTPARRKFLKSQGAETSHCWQTLHRLALGSPSVAFEAWQDGEKIFHYPPCETAQERVAQVYREAWGLKLDEADLKELRASSSPLEMQGWVLPSKHFIPSSRGILTFVNGRSVKDKLLQQAILAAAKEVLFGRLYPQLVLHLNAPPDWVDVNVHPAKSEVRFREPGHVFGFVRKHLERILADDRRGSVEMEAAPSALFPAATLADLLLPMPETSVHYRQKGAGVVEPSTPADLIPGALHQPPPAAYGGPQFLGTLRNTYLVCQDEEGLILVDQHAAHERVTYERLKASRLTGSGSSPLLISLQVELPRSTLDRIEAYLPRLAALGLVLERTGPTLVAIRELPNLLLKRDGSCVLPAGELLRKIAGDFEDHEPGEGLESRLKELLLHELATMSCHGSVRAGQTLSPYEAQALLAQMSATDFSGHCPHGRPTTLRFKWGEIERLFKRIV